MGNVIALRQPDNVAARGLPRDFVWPTTRDEAWIYTNLRPLQGFDPYVAGIGQDAIDLTAHKGQLATVLKGVPTPRIVLVNGHFRPELSVLDRLEGLTVKPVLKGSHGQAKVGSVWPGMAGIDSAEVGTGEALDKIRAGDSDKNRAGVFDQIRAGFAAPGIEICVDAGVTVDKPLWLVHVLLTDVKAKLDAGAKPLSIGGASLNVRLGKGSQLVLIEQYMGTQPGTAEPVTGPLTETAARTADQDPAGWLCDSRQIEVAAEAELRHVILQALPTTDFVTSYDDVTVADTAAYHRDVVQTGAALARFETEVTTGWAAFCRINALHLTRTAQTQGVHGWERVTQTHDVTTRIKHMAAATRSEVTQRNVLAAHGDIAGHSVFQGKFYVAQAAQKTDAYMRCENLLLSDHARTSQKPELEIYADDVKCSHGASTGGLSDEMLFYLQARGLTPTAGKALLVEGFAVAALAQAPAVVQKSAARMVTDWLASEQVQA